MDHGDAIAKFRKMLSLEFLESGDLSTDNN